MENTALKTCTKCKQTKSLEEFVKDNRRKDGHATICKECRRKADRERYQKLKEDNAFMERKREHNRNYKIKHKEEVDAYNAEYRMRPEVVERMREYNQNRKSTNSLIDKFRDIVHRCQSRAREKNIPCSITWQDIQEIYVTECPILEIPLDWNSSFTGRTDYTPSIDRIIPELGYVKGNIKIISNLANMMKSSSTFDQLQTFAKNILKYINCEEIVQATENNESVELQDKEPVR